MYDKVSTFIKSKIEHNCRHLGTKYLTVKKEHQCLDFGKRNVNCLTECVFGDESKLVRVVVSGRTDNILLPISMMTNIHNAYGSTELIFLDELFFSSETCMGMQTKCSVTVRLLFISLRDVIAKSLLYLYLLYLYYIFIISKRRYWLIPLNFVLLYDKGFGNREGLVIAQFINFQ